MQSKPLNQIVIGIKGAGEMASAVAWRLYKANLRRIFMMEVPAPLAVRRRVSFCEALHEIRQTVEDVTAVQAASRADIEEAWRNGQIAVLSDPEWHQIEMMRPDVLIDAILAKRNLGTTRAQAPLVIGLGPGFTAGQDTHLVIETNRGHHLGRIITTGNAAPNTGIPGNIGGYAAERVLRAPVAGIFRAHTAIGTLVARGAVVGAVDATEITAPIAGVLRGLIRPGVQVAQGMKLGDIDPRGDVSFCDTISDKARAIAGSVLEAILRFKLDPPDSNATTATKPSPTDEGARAVNHQELSERIRRGEMRAVAQAIDLIENQRDDYANLLDALLPHTGQAHRIGVTGPPGSGKSTFVNQLIRQFRNRNRTVGVVAVDPSSPFTGGALFGDRLRMVAAKNDPGVYIRSMGTRGSLGGLAGQAMAVADVLDASQKDVVIFETVGVGQIEVDIVAAADTVIVLTVPEAGDAVQTMKAGLMEIGHLFVVNKADLPGADRMRSNLESALQRHRPSELWNPVVLPAQASSGAGLDEIGRVIEAHWQFIKDRGVLSLKRLQQTEARIRMWTNDHISRQFWNPDRTQRLRDYLRKSGGAVSPQAVAQQLFKAEIDRGH